MAYACAAALMVSGYTVIDGVGARAAFGAVLAAVVLRESFGRRRLVAAALVALGAICVQLVA